MSVARPTDGLLPATATLALLDRLSACEGGVAKEQVIRDLAAAIPVSWSRSRNTITKLSAYGIITTSPIGLIRVAANVMEEPRMLIADHIANELVARLVENGAWSCLRFDVISDAIAIDAMTLPRMNDGLSMWVTEFGIAVRERMDARFWAVTERHQALLLEAVRTSNVTRPKRAKSAERLAAELARQAEDGEAAELWVLEYERGRLRDHPFCDQIRRVSADDVSAGYDIASFASHSSLQHDLFIEVKSYGAIKAFHWSRNEIATAEEFGEEYALYLVDRTRISQPGYCPHVITAPTREMFAQPGSGWRVEATSFEHVAIGT